MKAARASQKRIAVITGTRAEYGLLRSSIAAIDAHPRLELQLVVTGMHLLSQFGRTIHDIRSDGWPIAAQVRMQTGTDEPVDQAAGLGRGLTGIARFLERARSDVVLVLGDRIEAMAGALAAVTTGRALAHIHGGDIALGDFDDSLRHAITKLAHIHLTATAAARRRVIRMGEATAHVHLVGAPGLDRLRELILQEPPRKGRTRVALVVQHAHGRDSVVEEQVAANILKAVTAVGLKRVVIYPNSDRGYRGVLRAIEQHRQQSSTDAVQVHKSLPRDDFLRSLLEADVLIGNSSCGLIEAPLAGTPVVNVGVRQAGRQPGGSAIVPTAESEPAIRVALKTALHKRPRRGGRSIYGDGCAGRHIADILAKTEITPNLIKKQNSY